ncbi:hypothetical protein [Luteolibacter sp. LG18]|uniref:hypothetical protein n=1 Tax=Luteolibacter sp. LG18 TaxID=2819286 RepID=UPI002B310D11|nr:hypothetical protein llg_02210 [Luteolibacter sp. LG18]
MKLVALGDGATTATVTVPAAVENMNAGERFYSLATLVSTDHRRMLVELNAWSGEDASLCVSVSDPDSRPLARGADGNGLTIGGPVTLFSVKLHYTGPGEYEIYRNQNERMVVAIQ